MNIYLELTQKFNSGRLRAILGGGQAVVLHRLAIMSKDADWILREDQDTTDHVREAHAILVKDARDVLPFEVQGGLP